MKAVLLLLVLAGAAYAQQGGAPSPGNNTTPPTPGPPPPPSSPPPPQPAPSPPRPAPPPVPTPSGQPPRAAPTPAAPPSNNTPAATTALASGATPGGPSDADILELAFNLECFTANFYGCSAYGTPLDAALSGNGPAPSSCTKANLNSSVGTYAAELAREEAAHVKALGDLFRANGRSPVCPLVNIGTAFETAAEAAFGQAGQALSPTFDPSANDVFFLHGAFIFQDLAASAYLGAQALLQNSTYRLYASQIGANEAYQASLIRSLLYPIRETTPAYGKTVSQITAAIVGIVNQLAGAPQIKYELSNQEGSAISNVDSSGFVPAATAAQVLKVVTLGASSGNGGGFFPNNLNGGLKN